MQQTIAIDDRRLTAMERHYLRQIHYRIHGGVVRQADTAAELERYFGGNGAVAENGTAMPVCQKQAGDE